MLTFVKNCFIIWSNGDYVVWSFLAYIVIIVLLDIRYNYTKKLAKLSTMDIKQEDMMFVILFLSMITFFVINIKYDFIGSFMGIVDYDDVKLTLLRTRIVASLFTAYAILSIICPFVCSTIARRKNLGSKKWFFFGFFFNVLALIYLLSMISKTKDRSQSLKLDKIGNTS